VLELRNPHSVLAALQCRPHDVAEIQVPPGRLTDAWEQVAEAARSVQVPVSASRGSDFGGGRRQPKQVDGKSERVGIASARVREPAGVPEPGALFAQQEPAEDGHPGLWLALDCLQDPHNVGAVFRTAAFFGVRGVIVTRDRSAPLNGTVLDVAAGGVEHVPFCSVPNLSRTLDLAKKSGLWLLGSSEHAGTPLREIRPDRPWLLVIGNEEKGLRRLTLDHCDQVCSIPPRGRVTSLNVSAATAVMISQLGQPV